MNKLVKASIATAAGIALLMGGAGSLALWNDSVNVSAGTVSSGTLDVSTGTAGAWTINGATPFNATTGKIVPGDTVTFKQTLTLSATGDNLKATVTSNVASITNNISGSTATSSFVVKTDPAGTTVVPAAGTYTLNGAYTVEVTISIAFASSTTGLTGQNGSVNLSTLAITVNQV